MPGSVAITRGIRVTVESRLVPERSDPGDNEWYFAYRVRVANESAATVQLVSRHWIICDANGSKHEVRGPGVVGEQPTIAPGQTFEYVSACPLSTSFGTMHGSYRMITQNGDGFDAEVAVFVLGEPHSVN